MKFLTVSALALMVASAASAETFRWAGKTDPQTMDPHAVNSAPVLGFLNNVYEGLVRRGKDMAIEPALATSWEPIGDGEGWRFTLRQGVTFHDGSTFDAEDVVFSYQRASSEGSDTRSWFAPVSDVKMVDAYTVDVMTKAPNPIFPDSIANWMIMDKGWAEANNAGLPDKENGNYATLNANGTGAFMVSERQPGLTTTLVPFSGWWDEVEHNITSATFTPIDNPATAVAALLSGDVDMINPVPIQDAARVDQRDGLKVIRGIEARVIMLGFGHEADQLKYGAMAGEKNPFQDVRVREAVAKSINVDAIRQTIMRGSAEAASQLVSPAMRGYSSANVDRPAYDPAAAKALLAEAGYADGFSFGLKCPNNRYLNDEAVCQAVTGMLAQVGITAELDAMPVQNYWPELRADNFDMYMLGWSPGTFDHEHPVRFLVTTPNPEKKLGSWNFGGFSDARVDELLPMIQSEIDDTKRQAMIDETVSIYQDQHAYVPLYVQPLVWGTQDNIELTQRPDNFFILRWVTVN
ncbi:ABC transporter substrate-binding protein [Thalassovita mediterranea]|jgi:peptide/nickel transport system substrate-binding protein|uniref:Glutathione-binding protein GsiB n=1 Tax=Thalassovita mediterranea TaxID=340021 RepID=A0A0P1HFH2_9RHOB|nr:ABC transporter substrate-binding protein [Thalassovita mediterranea]CUH85729.1 Glutathione-binding protein GsiB precursor [Thalassovita mediterranea]SIS29830.1 peptide/nickel transport system substrate-binding protein [Thalassovita mediterranea]